MIETEISLTDRSVSGRHMLMRWVAAREELDAVTAVTKRHDVSEASIYVWREPFGEMVSEDVKRLKALEFESNRRKSR
jgi:hypothetical protein